MKIDWRMFSAFAGTYLTVQAVGVFLGAWCLILYRSEAWGTALVGFLPTIVSAVAATFLPTLVFAGILAAVITLASHRNWPPSTPFWVGTILTALFFFGLASLVSKPIPAVAMSFNPSVPDVARPGISLSEVPLLAASLIAGLAGAWVGIRIFHQRVTETDPRQADAG